MLKLFSVNFSVSVGKKHFLFIKNQEMFENIAVPAICCVWGRNWGGWDPVKVKAFLEGY